MKRSIWLGPRAGAGAAIALALSDALATAEAEAVRKSRRVSSLIHMSAWPAEAAPRDPSGAWAPQLRGEAHRMRMPHGSMPPPLLPISFFAFGLAALGAAVGGSGGAWAPLALLHAAVLGAFASIAMGALYQFVPVIGGSRLPSPPLGFVHLALHVVGTIAVIAGFQSGAFGVVGIGGAIVGIGALLQAGNLLATLWGKKGTPPPRMAAIALIWFLATVVAGAIAAFSVARGRAPGEALALHPILGVAGFFGTLIAAVSHRLLRMFERVNDERFAPAATLAVALAALIALWNLRVGSFALAAAALVVVWSVARIGVQRNPAYQHETFLYAALSAAGGLVAAVAALLDAWPTAIACALWLFVGAAVVGYIQRIVPFIWWIVRAQREGGKNIPVLGVMNASRLGYAVLILWAIASAWWILRPFAPAAAAIGFLAWLGLIAQLLRPFYLQKAASSDQGRPV